jgi:hypothetical protein
MSAAARPIRANGVAVLAGLVVLGLGITAGYFHFMAPKLFERMKRERAGLPEGGPGRLERWLEFGEPLICEGLVQLRLSPRQPWIATHTVGTARNAPDQEVWGVDLSGVGPDWVTREDMRVVVTLPAPELCGRGPIGGDKALNVPNVAPGVAYDAQARAREIVEFAFGGLIRALQRDIEGARFEIRFAPEAR